MDVPSVESTPQPVVRDLRSKFEQMSALGVPSSNEPPSPRSRTHSAAYTKQLHPDLDTPRHSTLRGSTSFSDLKTPKRPPPPPPSRSRQPSPSQVVSPLPEILPVSPRLLVSDSLEPPASVASLRSRFSNSSMQSNTPSTPSVAKSEDNSLEKLGSRFPIHGSLLTSHHSANASKSASEIVLSSSIPPISRHVHSVSLIDLNDDGGESTSVASLRDVFSNNNTSPAKVMNTSRRLSELILPSKQIIQASSPPVLTISSSHSSSSTSSLSDPFSNESDASDTTSSSSAATAAPVLPTRKPAICIPSTNYNSVPVRSHSNSSSESDLDTPSSIQKSLHRVPPKPPPRRGASTTPVSQERTPETPILALPPPLPQRRATGIPLNSLDDTAPVLPPPRLPHRPVPSFPVAMPPEAIITSHQPEKKSLGSGKLPPPPTRTIAPGDKLPPPRRPPTPSSDDEESGDEDEVKDANVLSIDLLPDSSQSSRRPPHLNFRGLTGYNATGPYAEQKIIVPAHVGFALSYDKYVILASTHYIRVWDVGLTGDGAIIVLDLRECGTKDVKVTAMEWRGPGKNGLMYVWTGTKEGHIIESELDFVASRARVSAYKPAAHLHHIAYIFRYGSFMTSVDESGKALIFSADGLVTGSAPPRVVRIAEKLDWARMLDGKLWTAARADQSIGGTRSVPIIRVYDLFNPPSMGRSVIPSGHVGAVTDATLLSSMPGLAYVSHEEGFITIWNLRGDGGYPMCVEVVKVASSDITSIEGVNDKLWAGGRSGMITVYDVSVKPWRVTNSWMAHPGLPIRKLTVDWFGVEKGKLCVLSIGRDERIWLWDGTLGLDWVDNEIAKRERSFSTFRDLKLLIMSWNCDSAGPEDLYGELPNVTLLHDILTSVDSPDLISFGFQEVIDLESRKMAAKNIIMMQKRPKTDEGVLSAALSESVSSAYKRWFDAICLAIRLAMPPDCPYSVLHSQSLVGLMTVIMVKNSEKVSIKDAAITTIKRGMGGRYGNKGGIMSRIVIDDTSICFINCHLAAGQSHVRSRNADVAGILEDKALFSATDEPLAYIGGGDGSMVLDHEMVFLNGDMNYRIDQRRESIVAAIKANEFETLHVHDQLLKELKFNRGFRLRGFSEGRLSFAPTYKYDRRSDEFDSSEKRRSPAWCDRVLWRCREPDRVHQLHYHRYEANVSDHRPISSAFKMTVKRVRQEVRQQVKIEVELTWKMELEKVLQKNVEFAKAQCLN